MGAWSCILPEQGTNLCLNPTGMGAGNVTDVAGGTGTFVTTYSYFGYKCHRLVTAADNTGAYYDLSALANAIHYVTLRIHSASDISPMFDCSLDNATWTNPTLLATEGDWYVYGYQAAAAEANASTKLYIEQDGAGACNIFIGHIQVEENTYTTTPITGDRKGFTDSGYYWNGSAHASSSTRSSQERSGGKVVDLDSTYSFKVKYGLGSGMPPITHHTQGMALLPGALYQGHKVEPRVLDLVSSTRANTVATVSAARKNFINAIKMDRVSPEQPVVFRYTGVNEDKPIDFHAYYDSGMEFQLSSGVVDQPVARFIAYDPFGYEVHTESAILTTSATVTDADCIVRKVDGAWYNVSTDFNSDVRAIIKGQDGCIYFAGGFTNVGDANGDNIVKWDPYSETLISLGTGTNNDVYALAVAPNGNIYLAGLFTLAGGVANTAHIAKWTGTAFEPLATGINGTPYTMAFGNDGTLYIGGDYLNAGGDANADNICKWTGAAFASIGGVAGADNFVYDIAIAPNGDIYATGQFHNIGGVAANHIAKWNGTAWSALGTGLDDAGEALAIDQAGNVIVGGRFSNANGVACAYIAKWNGKTFVPLGSGVNNTVYELSFNENGILYASGYFTIAGGLSLTDKMAMWNGTTWAHLDIELPGDPIVYTIAPINQNTYIGYDTAGTATASYLNTITNNGSTTAYPVIKINRADDGTSAVLEWIKNETTGTTLWCDYSLLGGEELEISLTPGNRYIRSNYFGIVWRAVLRSSDFSAFNLLPGENKISVFVNPTGAPTITAWMEYPIAHWSSDGVAA
jgi:hypothetical protein